MAQDKKDPKADESRKASSPTVEQETRIAKQKAEAEAKGGGPNKPEKGLNQDG